MSTEGTPHDRDRESHPQDDSHLRRVDALTASKRGELTAPARNGSFGKLLRWARSLDPERVWAIEDCRHVSGAPPPRPRGQPQLNCALHRVAVNKGKWDPDTAAYLERKQAEGNRA